MMLRPPVSPPRHVVYEDADSPRPSYAIRDLRWGQVIYFDLSASRFLWSVKVALSPLHHDLKTVDLSLADAFSFGSRYFLTLYLTIPAAKVSAIPMNSVCGFEAPVFLTRSFFPATFCR
jgi:hypothetical protein